MTKWRWDEERLEAAKRLWIDGKSASEIAALLMRQFDGEVSRNAVIGKLSREGAPLRSPEGMAVASRMNGRRAAARKPHAPKEARALKHAAITVFTDPAKRTSPWKEPQRNDTARVTFDGLKRRHCRWPVGDPKKEGFGFCGDVIATGCYCATHFNRAFPTRERAA